MRESMAEAKAKNDQLVARYVAGESVDALAKELGIPLNRARSALIARGVMRTPSEAKRQVGAKRRKQVA